MNDLKSKCDLAFLKMAKNWSDLSRSDLKVGTVIVTKSGIVVSEGYSGIGYPFDIKTHSEYYSIIRSNQLKGTTLYTTHAPCLRCSQLIIKSEIIRVVYLNDSTDNGISLLKEFGIEVEKL